MFQVLFSPNEPEHFLGFLPPGTGSASVHADPDPGGISFSESVQIRIQNTEKN